MGIKVPTRGAGLRGRGAEDLGMGAHGLSSGSQKGAHDSNTVAGRSCLLLILIRQS